MIGCTYITLATADTECDSMYKMKHIALDSIVYSVTELRRRVKMMRLESFLKQAEIVPFLQPIFHSDGKVLKGCEVLLRVAHKGKLVLPSTFINDLEDSAMLDFVTCSLFEKVSQELHQYKHLLPEGFYFSFNIVSQQLLSDNVLNSAIQFNNKFKDRASLILEIVERRTEYIDAVIHIMNSMIANGICFAIDDFGTGTTSFKYVESTGFSVVKIDKSLTPSNDGGLIYKNTIDAIVSLSKKLGLSVTAEGVENPEQIGLLNNAGVNYLQGFFLARPMSAYKFVDLYLTP